MSELPPAQRPAPLRVPVADVATRSSLVAPTPPPPEAKPSVVIQRAVRVLSDAPATNSASPSDTPTAPSAQLPDVRALQAAAEARALPPPPEARALPPPPEARVLPPPPEARAFPSSPVPEPRPLPSSPAPEPRALPSSPAPEPRALPSSPAPEPRALPSSPAPTPAQPAAAVNTPSSPAASPSWEPGARTSIPAGLPAIPPAARVISDAPAPPPPPEARATAANGGSFSESYAAVEVEPIDTLELAESFEDTEPVEEHVLDVSMPPPAPPEALRRPSPSNDNNDQGDVEITVGDAEEDDDGYEDYGQRPSGEFEELEIDAERAGDDDEPLRSVPPPPPPPRLHIPEPPDLSTLTRTARVQEIRPSKPRSHPWWEVLFDDDYLRTVRAPSSEQIARQCDFIERRLRLKPGGTVLDVGCGLGLQVVELCTRGYLGVGLDLSLAMLSRASEEAQARGMRINFLHSDMRDMNFDGAFDAVICLGTSFGYFDDDTNRKVLERCMRALKPGGLLLLDVVNRDHVIRAQPNLVWFEGDGCVCMEESEFNFFTSRLHVKRTVILDGGKQTETEYALRLYSLHELGQLLHSAGFRVIEVSGREALTGVFFGQESPQMIIVAERKPSNEPTGKHDATGKYPVVE
jgi:2-polyprenyl-3-methyl-5-hydroxy-6-metoxy-1,4-benzoquinol methylase